MHAHGKGFTGGLDLMDVAPVVQNGSVNDLIPEGSVDPWGTQTEPCPKPVVVAVHGTCMTLGIELILASEICIAASNTRFSQMEVGRGLIPFGGATMRMPAVFGWQNAMRYLLTGDFFDAQEAYRLGLVTEIVEPGQQLPRALELAAHIAKQAPLAVQATLANARKARTHGPDAAARDLVTEVRRMTQTKDFTEGVMSFMQRRPPEFKGE